MLTELLLFLILLALLVQLHQQKPALPAGIIPGPVLWELQRLMVQIQNILNLANKGGMRHA